MANLVFSRLSSASALSRTFGRHVLSRTTPTASLLANKQITTTSVLRERKYGPLPVSEQVDDLHHWTNERYLALAMIPIIPAALAYPNPVLDTALAASLVLHCHWRFSGVAQDYIHTPGLHAVAKYSVLALSIAAFGSLCYFNYYDVGFSNAARMIFSEL